MDQSERLSQSKDMKHLKDIFNLNVNVYKELIHTYLKIFIILW